MAFGIKCMPCTYITVTIDYYIIAGRQIMAVHCAVTGIANPAAGILKQQIILRGSQCNIAHKRQTRSV